MAALTPVIAQPLINPGKTGILIRNDTLYWSISPLMTIADLGVMRKKIGEFGGDFMVENLEIDPLKRYITAITVSVKSKSGSTGLGSTEGLNAMPIKHYSGYLVKNGLSIGSNYIPEPLSQRIKTDYQQALAYYKQSDTEYARRNNAKFAYEGNGIIFPKRLLEGKASDAILERSGVGKSVGNTFLITDMYRNAELYLNEKKVNVDELNALPFDRVIKVEIKKERFDKKCVIVYAN
ncbi:hypothetical protein SAMN05660293_00979 [Dyadobacter psychrophilus]|uniref:Uncharacterized protein n=2 Tax=Dyadobacter psychrophilus TaxID=651661 RepID=A0A1T5C7I5_9BACT|nr:hypothetical protein SAMN05660293_00979 [Dyadobacter psychrophilus]